MWYSATTGRCYVGDLLPGDREATADELLAHEAERLPTTEQIVAAKLSERGLTLETEWQLYAGIAGMLALGALQGKSQEQLYSENTGFRNALDMANAIVIIRGEE